MLRSILYHLLETMRLLTFLGRAGPLSVPPPQGRPDRQTGDDLRGDA